MNDLKCFEIQFSNGNKAWIAAKTNLHALRTFWSSSGFNIFDFEDDDRITEIPEEHWDMGLVTDENGNGIQSFKDYMSTAIHADIICQTT